VTSKPNLSAVRALIADAKPIPTVKHRFKGDPEPGGPREGVNAGQWRPDQLGLPPDCPVLPLGVDGSANWFLDPIGQLYCYTKPYGQADTLELFRGRHLYLYWAWPKWGRGKGDDGKPACDGWRNEKARETLIAACTAKGPWNAVERVRGRGSWTDPDGGLVVHTGENVLIGGRRQPPGEINGSVYPTRPAIPDPWPTPVEDKDNPAKLLRPLLQSWNWARPYVDPQLLLGWIGAALLSGALPWRPAVFITGDKGTGKSTLQELIKGLLGDWLIQAVDTSAAGLYQRVGHDCLPIAVDELEGEADVKKQKAVLKLARIAASGGLMLRGGDKHQGVEFRARSCFLFSSINTPPLEPQDLSRMALLRLARLPPSQPAPDLPPNSLSVVGRCILRRLMDEWPRFDETWSAFREELGAGGMDARGQDTFGTLLAIADMIENEGWNEDRLKTPGDGDMFWWRDLMAADTMAEFEDATENWLGCLNHLLSVPVEAWRNGNKTTVGQVLEAWFGRETEWTDIVKVRGLLSQAGLMLRIDGKQQWLAVPNQSPSVRRMFEGSKWAGETGASVWSGALRQAPRGTVYETGQTRVNGVKSKCTLINLDGLYGEGGVMSTAE